MMGTAIGREDRAVHVDMKTGDIDPTDLMDSAERIQGLVEDVIRQNEAIEPSRDGRKAACQKIKKDVEEAFAPHQKVFAVKKLDDPDKDKIALDLKSGDDVIARVLIGITSALECAVRIGSSPDCKGRQITWRPTLTGFAYDPVKQAFTGGTEKVLHTLEEVTREWMKQRAPRQ